MPKDRSRSYLPSDRSRDSPYSRTSKKTKKCGSKSTLVSEGDEREWEDARCAICMEHPHNAVLLLCSSHEKGCRPYMCDTSYRHSYCFDQFRKSSPSIQTTGRMEVFSRFNNVKQLENKLLCPLCRGQISGYMVVESSRRFMNSKRRSCSLESCKFIGNYTDLRKHARREHPAVRPTEADPTRQQEWTSLENESTFDDLAYVYAQTDAESNWSDWDSDGWDTVDWGTDSELDLPSTLQSSGESYVDREINRISSLTDSLRRYISNSGQSQRR